MKSFVIKELGNWVGIWGLHKIEEININLT